MHPIRSVFACIAMTMLLCTPAVAAIAAAETVAQPTPSPAPAASSSPAPVQAEPPNSPPGGPPGPSGGAPPAGGPPHGPPPPPPLTHIPSINIIPTINFSTTGADAPGNPLVNGDLDVTFVVNESLTRQLTAHYDHIYGGNFSGSAALIALAPALGGGPFNPGSNRDLIEQVRLEYEQSGIGVELSDWYRRRICCPAASVNAPNAVYDHDLIFTVGYSTAPISALGGFVLSYGISGHHAPHHPGTAYLASLAGTGDTDSVRTESGISQRVTVVAPQLARKEGLVVSETFLFGSLDYFDNAPYPSMYDIFITNVSKRLSKNLTVIVYASNLTQRNQSNLFPNPPFGNSSKLHLSGVNAGLNIRVP